MDTDTFIHCARPSSRDSWPSAEKAQGGHTNDARMLPATRQLLVRRFHQPQSATADHRILQFDQNACGHQISSSNRKFCAVLRHLDPVRSPPPSTEESTIT